LESSFSFSFFRTMPARNPRTECCCQPVAFIIAAIVVPLGDRSIVITCDCIEPAAGFLHLRSPEVGDEGFAAGTNAADVVDGFFAGFDMRSSVRFMRLLGRTTDAPPQPQGRRAGSLDASGSTIGVVSDSPKPSPNGRRFHSRAIANSKRLFYDYRFNVSAYPKWQAWLKAAQPKLLVLWGKYDPSFDIGEPDRYREDVPNAEVVMIDSGHFALDTKAYEIAALVEKFMNARQ
jgi:pimeloyl-ACP methyl ester carboxylesterase